MQEIKNIINSILEVEEIKEDSILENWENEDVK
jgi:hypothetical protein